MNNGGGGIIGLIVLALIGWWVYNTFIKTDYSKPWWTGTQDRRVCDTDGIKCYTLPVSSDGKHITQVGFPNGGYIIPSSSECNQAASGQGFDRFCTIWEESGKSWDILP